jgi:Mrp family chromosome partitioning ATPase
MPRILDALNQTGFPEAPPSAQEEPCADSAAEEIPYIEIGPRRSVEASPGVLAPAPAKERPATVAFRPAAAPAERNAEELVVTFRPVAPGVSRPRSRFAATLVAQHAAGEPASQPWVDLLAVLLAEERPRGRAPSWFFTAGSDEVGTTTTLLNLAIVAARQQKRVLVVDANLRRPAIASMLGLGEVPGLREVLRGEVSFEQAIQPTEVPTLSALTSGPLPGPARLTVDPSAVRVLLEKSAEVSDLVLVDGSRWDGRPDVTAFGAACDRVYLVVPRREADTPAIQSLLQLIPEQGGRLAGCILSGR